MDTHWIHVVGYVVVRYTEYMLRYAMDTPSIRNPSYLDKKPLPTPSDEWPRPPASASRVANSPSARLRNTLSLSHRNIATSLNLK